MSWMFPRGSNFGFAKNDKRLIQRCLFKKKKNSSVLSSHRRIFSDLAVTPFNNVFLVLVLSAATAQHCFSTQLRLHLVPPPPSLAPRTSLDECRILFIYLFFLLLAPKDLNGLVGGNLIGFLIKGSNYSAESPGFLRLQGLDRVLVESNVRNCLFLSIIMHFGTAAEILLLCCAFYYFVEVLSPMVVLNFDMRISLAWLRLPQLFFCFHLSGISNGTCFF